MKKSVNPIMKTAILPVRFDNTELPGMLPTIGYISLSDTAPEQLGQLILEKLETDWLRTHQAISAFYKR